MLKTGIDRLQAQQYDQVDGAKLALLTHPTAVNHAYTSTYHLLQEASILELTALFAPVPHAYSQATDQTPETPVYALYDATERPTQAMLEGIDLVVVDLPNWGVRYDPTLYLLGQVIDVCGLLGKQLIILDRPNPLGGNRIAGRGLKEGYASRYGQYDIPNQHGMTLGELALMMNAVWYADRAQITVVECEGYQRDMTWEAMGLPYVPPTSTLPTIGSLRQVVGARLLDGTHLSIGHGTSLPYQVVGAPYLDGKRFAHYLNKLDDLQGVRFRPCEFTPLRDPYAQQVCHGVQVHITDPQAYHALTTWLHILYAVHKYHSDHFAWSDQRVRDDLLLIDSLFGNAVPREKFDGGASVREVMQGWDDYCQAFRERRQAYLLYD